jgi:hypothetical protein
MAPHLISPAFFQSYYSVQSIDKFFQVYLSTGLRPRPFAPGISSGIVEITIDGKRFCGRREISGEGYFLFRCLEADGRDREMAQRVVSEWKLRPTRIP